MPITTLNKAIALFLVGGVVIGLAIVLHWEQARVLALSNGSRADDLTSGFWVLAGFLIFPLAALVGSIVEGLSEVSLQPILKRARSSKRIARLLCRGKSLDNLEFWRTRFLETTRRESLKSAGTHHATDTRVWMTQATASGELLGSASTQEFQWVAQHYATFVLASNLAFVLLGTLLYVPSTWLASTKGWWWPAFATLPNTGTRVLLLFCGIIGFWALGTQAVGKYLYSKEVGARQASLRVENEARSGASSGKDRPTQAVNPATGDSA